MFSFLEQKNPKHNLLILWILSKCWFSHFWIWAPCNQFPNEKQSVPEPFSFSDKFSLNLRSISFKVYLMKMNQNSRPFLPHFISLARFILCFYRIYGKIRGFSKTVNLRNSSTAYHRNTFHTAVCKKSSLRFMFFSYSRHIVIWFPTCLTVQAKYFLNWVSHNIMLILLRKNVISTYIGCNTMNVTKVSSYFAFD